MKYSKYATILILDLAFFLSFFYILPFLAKTFIGNLVIPTNQTTLIILHLILAIAYFLLILVIYSFTKYSILDLIKEKSQNNYKRFKEFFVLNLIISAIALTFYFIIGYILDSTKPEYQPVALFLLVIPYALVLYLTLNTAHSLFYQKKSVKTTFKVLKKIYKKPLLTVIISAVAMIILFHIIGYLIRLTATNYSLYLTLYAGFKQISVVISGVVAYIVLFVNRISFYNLVKSK